jgi:galactose mutarotase-like enzyme
MIQLENANLKLTISKLGAEIKSLIYKPQQRECMWQADPKVWGRTAPVLFPIVGQVRNNNYKYNTQSYNMTQHGFARDCEFSVVSQHSDAVTLELIQNETTLKKYPFQFNLLITYKIINQKVEVSYKVTNPSSSKILPFSIGAHPGFACPFDTESNFEDYDLVFEQCETADKIEFSEGLLTGSITKNYLNNSTKIPVNRPLFKDDALIFKQLKSKTVSIKHRYSNQELKLHFNGFPYLGIWTQPKQPGNFICLEPWYGITDSKNSPYEFLEKEGRQKLAPNQTFKAHYAIEVI